MKNGSISALIDDNQGLYPVQMFHLLTRHDDIRLKTSWHRLHIDPALLITMFLILSLGLFVLISASSLNFLIVKRQAISIAVSCVIMLIIAQIPPRYFSFVAPWLYAAGVLLLVGVLLFGETSKGAQRWLNVGLFRFQPSEIMKLAVPMTIAWLLQDKILPLRFPTLVIALTLTIIPSALVALQPDLDTALLIVAGGFLVIFLAGISWRLLGCLGVLAVMAAPIAWSFLHDYQRRRIFTFLAPETDPLGAGYHIIQSTIAIGSGGLYGKGWLAGTQSHLQFLPERTTDFIFAVLGEELGFLGIAVLLILYAYLIVRMVKISLQAQDTFTRLLSVSLTFTFFIYLFVNIGMVCGVLPVMGIPLPLFSYGGTSLVTIMAGFGILMSIHTHRKLLAT